MANYRGRLNINNGEVGGWTTLELTEREFEEFTDEQVAFRILLPAFAAARR